MVRETSETGQRKCRGTSEESWRRCSATTIMHQQFGFSNKIYYLCIRKAEQEWNGEQVWTRKKKFFQKKVSKYQPIFFLRLELTDRQTDSVSEGKWKVSGKYQESVSKYHPAAAGDTGRRVRDCRFWPQQADYVALTAAVNGRFGNAPTPWALVARAVGN